MRVVSFKVSDDVYTALRSKKMSFRAIFEPIAVKIAQNNRSETQYTGGIRKNSSDLYSDISQIQKLATKILKIHEFRKNEQASKDMEVQT